MNGTKNMIKIFLKKFILARKLCRSNIFGFLAYSIILIKKKKKFEIEIIISLSLEECSIILFLKKKKKRYFYYIFMYPELIPEGKENGYCQK